VFIKINAQVISDKILDLSLWRWYFGFYTFEELSKDSFSRLRG
jgi:hypothetical protein